MTAAYAPAYIWVNSACFPERVRGSITNSGVTSDTLVNVNDTIAGAGSISVSVFDNQAGGNVVASQVRGSALQISSATFTNEGQMVAGTTAALDFGTDGQSGSLTNTGGIWSRGWRPCDQRQIHHQRQRRTVGT